MNSKIFSAIEHIKSVASAPKITFGDAAMAFNTINKYFDYLMNNLKLKLLSCIDKLVIQSDEKNLLVLVSDINAIYEL